MHVATYTYMDLITIDGIKNNIQVTGKVMKKINFALGRIMTNKNIYSLHAKIYK